MRKYILSGLVLLTLLFVVAGRNLRDLAGYFRASADVAADGLTEQLPTEVHDRKLDHDLERARQELAVSRSTGCPNTVDTAARIASSELAEGDSASSSANSRCRATKSSLPSSQPSTTFRNGSAGGARSPDSTNRLYATRAAASVPENSASTERQSSQAGACCGFR